MSSEPPSPADAELRFPRDAPPAAREALADMVASVQRMADRGIDLGDLKMARAAIGEMGEAFELFEPLRRHRKVTMFGSARTQTDDPLYRHAKDLAARMAGEGWMVVTGAGPGIMAAGAEGAGAEHAVGVNIRLPHEQVANEFIAPDPKLVQMRYFFTRKLMLMKESHAYVFLPGGFGTMDEAFELLTLLQTGKTTPAPVVLLDTPGGGYWHAWLRFVEEGLAGNGYISEDDRALFVLTDDCAAAAHELTSFYRNYHSCRWVGDLLVLRLHEPMPTSSLDRLNAEFADIVRTGTIHPVDPFPPERAGNDHLDLQRLAFRFDRLHFGRLRQLVDALNAPFL